MANTDPKWMDDKLASLEAKPGEFDVPRARALLRERSQGSPRARLIWAAAVAACLVLAVLPAAGGRVWKRFFVMKTIKHPMQRVADFALRDAEGKLVRLSDYRGKVVLLNFWATWCVPCQHEVPWFIDFTTRFKNRGFTVLGVSLDEEGWEPVRAFMAEKHVNYPVVLAKPDELPAPYNAISALPKTYLIDSDGNLIGEYDALASKEAYEEWIASALRFSGDFVSEPGPYHIAP